MTIPPWSRRARAVTLLVSVLLAGSGVSCSSTDSGRFYPVRGQVLFKGRPVAGAMVVLHPLGPAAAGQKPLAYTDAEGRFGLTTDRPGDGVPAGEYAVTVVWRRPFYDSEGKPGPNLLPARYADPKKSGLKATVKSGKNEFIFELEKAAPKEPKP